VKPLIRYAIESDRMGLARLAESSCGQWYAKDEADARIAELEAERDAALADAERYRWIRDSLEGNLAEGYEIVERAFRGGLDAAIDKARSKE
jgi:hypothetical protein